MDNPLEPTDPCPASELEVVKIFVSPDRYRAFHRCVWIQVHETGCSQLEIMEKMVDDFLRNHGC